MPQVSIFDLGVPDPGVLQRPVRGKPAYYRHMDEQYRRPAVLVDSTSVSVIDRLVEAGITTPFLATLGALKAPDTPYLPRSTGFPITLVMVEGRYELHLSTPACADLPFVRRVEEVTGLKARWVPEGYRGSLGQWHHAIDLATDKGWEQLARSMDHTTTADVARAVGLCVEWGSLSTSNARRLLQTVGIEEPPAAPAKAPRKAKAKKPPVATPPAYDSSEAGLTDLPKAGLADKAEVHAAIGEILPRGVPTYVKAVLGVKRMSGRLIADVRLFDDAVGRVEISGEKGAHGYRWHHCGVPGTAFHWDEKSLRWERVEDIA